MRRGNCSVCDGSYLLLEREGVEVVGKHHVWTPTPPELSCEGSLLPPQPGTETGSSSLPYRLPTPEPRTNQRRRLLKNVARQDELERFMNEANRYAIDGYGSGVSRGWSVSGHERRRPRLPEDSNWLDIAFDVYESVR